MSALSEKAMLASFNVSQWTARRLDRKQTAALNSTAGAVAGAARVNKSLLPTSMNLVNLHKKTGNIRTYYYQQTLPWALDGPRIMPSRNYMDFTTAMRDHINEWRGLKQKFVDGYTNDVNEAQTALGQLFKVTDYPVNHELSSKFNIDLTFLPIPDERDWRVDLSDLEVARLSKELAAQADAGLDKAMEEVWQRVADVVRNAHNRLKDPDAVFRDTLVENAAELVELLPSLNLRGDKEMDAVRKELENSLLIHRPDTLRNAPTIRQGVSDKMAELDAKFGHLFPAS